MAKFAEQMRKEHKVPDSRIYVVGSSGLFSALESKKRVIQANQETLAAAVHEACGLQIGFIDVNREIELSIAGIVPAKHAADSLLLDIGGGNTKGGYRDADKKCVTVSIPYGSVTFADLVEKHAEKGKYVETAAALRAEILVPALRKSIDEKPELLKRNRFYLSGGAVWAMVSFIRPSDRRSYVALTAGDIAAYHQLLIKTPDTFPKISLSTIEEAEVREAANKEIESVKKVYQPRQLLAGAEILQALSSEFHFDKEKKLYFARNAPTGWIPRLRCRESGGSARWSEPLGFEQGQLDRSCPVTVAVSASDDFGRQLAGVVIVLLLNCQPGLAQRRIIVLNLYQGV